MGTADASYGSRHHRPYIDHGGITDVPCSAILSAYATEESSIADRRAMLSVYHVGEKNVHLEPRSTNSDGGITSKAFMKVKFHLERAIRVLFLLHGITRSLVGQRQLPQKRESIGEKYC